MATPSLKDRALQDPPGAFESPEAVLHSGELQRQDKRDILERWRHLTDRQEAEDAPGLMTRILRALAYLDVQTGKHRPIPGMGRHNHENDVAIPGFEDLVVLSGDDTFTSGPLTIPETPSRSEITWTHTAQGYVVSPAKTLTQLW